MPCKRVLLRFERWQSTIGEGVRKRVELVVTKEETNVSLCKPRPCQCHAKARFAQGRLLSRLALPRVWAMRKPVMLLGHTATMLVVVRRPDVQRWPMVDSPSVRRALHPNPEAPFLRSHGVGCNTTAPGKPCRAFESSIGQISGL